MFNQRSLCGHCNLNLFTCIFSYFFADRTNISQFSISTHDSWCIRYNSLDYILKIAAFHKHLEDIDLLSLSVRRLMTLAAAFINSAECAQKLQRAGQTTQRGADSSHCTNDINTLKKNKKKSHRCSCWKGVGCCGRKWVTWACRLRTGFDTRRLFAWCNSSMEGLTRNGE